MLILTRKINESIVISGDFGTIEVMLTAIEDKERSKIGVNAPKSIRVDRKEIYQKRKESRPEMT